MTTKRFSPPPIPKCDAYNLAIATAEKECVRIASHDLFEQYITFRTGGMDSKTVSPVTVASWVEAYDRTFNKIIDEKSNNERD